MRGKNRWLLAAGLAIGTLGAATVANAQALLDSSFNYQGQLKSGLNLVEVNSDFRFTVWDSVAGGVQIAGPITRSNTIVRDGVFTVNLDFGTAPFNGEARFLQIEARTPAGVGAFVTLAPRQKIQVAPYALQAQSGNAPFNIQAPGSTNSVLHNPDGGVFIQSARGGIAEFTQRTNGSRGSGLLFTTPGGEFSLFAGSDARDGEGFIGLYPTGGGTLDGTVDIDADDDNDATNGIQNGAIDIRSTGTGGGGGIVRLRNNDNAQTLQAVGGASGGGANVELFNGASGVGVVSLAENFIATPGGRLHLKRPDGGFQFDLEPDFSAGGGAFFSMGGNTTFGGNIFMQTNDGSNNASLSVSGAGSSFGINTTASNNTNTVQMSGNAVDALEIFDEPGVANNHAGSTAMPASTGTLISRSITVPGPGFVVVLAQGDLAVTKAAASSDFYVFGVSDSATTLPTDQDIQVNLPSGLPAGTYDSSAAAHGLFSVGAAGTFTYFFNGRASGSPATMFDLNLTLRYFPTAYGSTLTNFTGGFAADNSNHGPVGAPLTAADIAAERENAVKFNQARVMKELADIQVRTEQLKRFMEASLAEQSVSKAKASKVPARDETTPAVEPVAINTKEVK